ncbi:MAG: hypothetical protein ACE5OQ_10275 [Woeseia sp.]
MKTGNSIRPELFPSVYYQVAVPLYCRQRNPPHEKQQANSSGEKSMKTRYTAALAVLLCAFMFGVPASAQDHERNWENGTVLQVTHVHIKPGMFNAYINDLNGLWRLFLEEQMKDGSVVGYRMWGNPSSREGEADLILTVEYANWAAFDRGIEYFEELSVRLRGSLENMRQLGVKREELREIGSTITLQEIKFKD